MLNRSDVLRELDAERLRAVETHEHFAFLLLRVQRHREEHQLFGDYLSKAARTRIRGALSPQDRFISTLDGSVVVNALGFSQGGATICRWAASTKFKIDNLIVWGSVIPPDMNWEVYLSNISVKNWIYVAGDNDEFLNTEQQKTQLELLKKYNITPETVLYNGGHDILEEPLRLLTQKCVKKQG